MNGINDVSAFREPTGSSDPGVLATSTRSQPLGYWLKRFLAGNPFYLVSAALLLYGVYRVSVDPNFLSKEFSQLLFNYTSLQLYEVLLVATAIFLAGRRIWYDSMLLVALENLLVLVPLIVVSQAALLDMRTVWPLSLAAGCIAVARFAALKRFIRELKLPVRLSLIGLAMLLVNVALPVLYRIFQQTKVGKQPDFGAAYYTNQIAWLLMLPALCALANLIPYDRGSTESSVRRGWPPLGLFGLWLIGTGVHLYSLSYVYDFNMHWQLWAPAIWVLLWTAHLRALEVFPALASDCRRALLVLPLLATFLAASAPGNLVFLVLTFLNVGIYGAGSLRDRKNRLSRHLFLISLVALAGGLPENWGRALVAEFTRTKAIEAGVAGYFLIWSVLSRSAKLGLFGALVVGATVVGLSGDNAAACHWALEAALAFLLAHSLRWVDGENPGASAVRIIAAGGWTVHALVWMHCGGSTWMACAVAAPVLGLSVLQRLVIGSWGSLSVSIAALLVMLAGPGDFSATEVQTAPVGLLAVVGSFLLFGLGTLAAITKHRWLR